MADLGNHFLSQVAEFNGGVAKNYVLELARQILIIPAHPAEVVSASVPQDLPSTRAGSQDDVSLNKLPQNHHGYAHTKMITMSSCSSRPGCYAPRFRRSNSNCHWCALTEHIPVSSDIILYQESMQISLHNTSKGQLMLHLSI